MKLFNGLPGFNRNAHHRVHKKKAVIQQGQKHKKQGSGRKKKDYVQVVDHPTAAVNQTPADVAKEPGMEEHDEEPAGVAMSMVPESAEPDEDTANQDYDTERLMAQIYKDIHVASLPDRVKSTREFGKLLAAEARNFSFNSWIKMNIALQTQQMFKVIQYATRRFSSKGSDLRQHISAIVDQLSDGTDKLGRASSIVEDEWQLISRYGQFASKHGWMMLSILANSAAFREAARTLDKVRWTALCDCVCENKNSIEVFAKSRELDWKAALEQKRDFDKWVLFRNEQYPDLKPPQHPHHLIVPARIGLLKSPTDDGKDQINILSCRFNEADFASYERPLIWPGEVEYPSDPTNIHKVSAICALCFQTDCSCSPLTHPSVIRPLVELVEYGGKGVGIRALQPIEKLNPLGEYVGEIMHPRNRNDLDGKYAISLPVSSESHECVAIINARQYGNWTRYMNHSCDPNCAFDAMLIGRKQRAMMMTLRDVAMFEELTVHYGDEYWIHRDNLCQCGSTKCRFATREQIIYLRKQRS